jgi:hypothetical protein
MDRMVQAHVNTVVLSYWSNMPQWSPMQIDATTIPGVPDAVQGRPLVILPTIEGGFDSQHPEIPHWEFSHEFPGSATGLICRIGDLVELFDGKMNLWARLYDRAGDPRYAVHILHVGSQASNTTDQQFAQAFDKVATKVADQYGILIGFTLDPIGGLPYSPNPRSAGTLFESTASVLAIQGYICEVFSGLIRNGPPCSDPDWHNCHPVDNNKPLAHLEALADWKRATLQDWVGSGVPVILDVSNGFDGRIVWAKDGAGFWGDNLEYTYDHWRNWLSELKGKGVKGITVNTWNGYTEGYATVPSVEHGDTVYNWLVDLLESPPWDFSHMHYVNGARTFRVYGAICEKWIQLGADRGFGAPTSDEQSTGRGRVQHFADGKAIYWTEETRAHEVHGIIAQTYLLVGAGASRLGFPISDEVPNGQDRVQYFEHGRIDWSPGDTVGRITY